MSSKDVDDGCVVFLKPFDPAFKEALQKECVGVKASMTRYIERILKALGPRGRAEAFSDGTRSDSMAAARRTIENARMERKAR